MDRNLIKAFWNCGDTQIIEFSMARARLNKKEREVLRRVLDDCETQEQAAENMEISTRSFQTLWYSATAKLLAIPWVIAYAKELQNIKEG